jgi:hypothetical protein
METDLVAILDDVRLAVRRHGSMNHVIGLLPVGDRSMGSTTRAAVADERKESHLLIDEEEVFQRGKVVTFHRESQNDCYGPRRLTVLLAHPVVGPILCLMEPSRCIEAASEIRTPCASQMVNAVCQRIDR